MAILHTKYDAIIIGSGPNGLSAAITLQEKGLQVLIIEARDNVGGGARSGHLTPNHIYDICSSIHPMAIQSPFFNRLPLENFGLEWILSPITAAHPLDDHRCVSLQQSLDKTAKQFGNESDNYINLFRPLIEKWPKISNDILSRDISFKNISDIFKFGIKAIQPANHLAKIFKNEQAKALWAGMAAHSMLPFNFWSTSAIALILSIAGHTTGWPIVKGGTQMLSNSLLLHFQAMGGHFISGWYINSINELPSSSVILFDTSPKEMVRISGSHLSNSYINKIKSFKYGMGAFKIDWLLSEPIPFLSKNCKKAGTIHVGGSYNEIYQSENSVWRGNHPEKPFVLLAQQSLFDNSRSKDSNQILWGYCHVPNGSQIDMTERVEKQIERFAPGFRDIIISRKTTNTNAFQKYNSNYIGGDFNGGAMTLKQMLSRPTTQISPYRTSSDKIYICSASTPPGGGVHGMCGHNAAIQVLQDKFKIN